MADAKDSRTKFIVSDHPVTVYNRSCGPRSVWCRGHDDPDVRFHASHTLFPLSLDKVLILTNRSWARNPYLHPRDYRPNPDFFRETFFNFTEIQTERHLTEAEVLQINFILKSRAYEYVAAARQEWLYPEAMVSKSDWPYFGEGYLLMPDPRGLHHGGEIYIGYKDGSSSGFDEFGRRPWQQGFGMESPPPASADALLRFKGEFARLFGPRRRGRSFDVRGLEPETDSEDVHRLNLSRDGLRPGS